MDRNVMRGILAIIISLVVLCGIMLVTVADMQPHRHHAEEPH
jgi:hypothetical protein